MSALWFFSGHVSAQATSEVNRSMDQVSDISEDEKLGFTNGSFIVVPVPFSNPTIGSGLALGGGYLFRDDAESDTSVIGIGALRSDNGSEAYGVIANFAFNRNEWIIESFFGQADMSYDLFLGQFPVPIRQEGDLARFKLAYGITPRLSFGTTLRYLNTLISSDGPGVLPPQFVPDADLELMNFGLTTDWDTRDDGDYPTEGLRLDIDLIYGEEIDDDGRGYGKAFVLLDGYRSFGPRSVLAARGALCAASTDAPFFDLCSLGGTDAFRGFSSAQFLNQRLLSGQIEWRQRLNDRWGIVAFGGIGWTGDTLDSLTKGGSHSAIGAGLRYRVSKKFPVDFSVDVSHNNEGDENLYISVGQRF